MVIHGHVCTYWQSDEESEEMHQFFSLPPKFNVNILLVFLPCTRGFFYEFILFGLNSVGLNLGSSSSNPGFMKLFELRSGEVCTR